MPFSVGDKIVYPNHGVGVIEDIHTQKLGNTRQKVYRIRILSNATLVMVPVDNADMVGLRPLLTKKQVDKLLIELQDGSYEAQKNWKGRFKENSERMRSGDICEVVQVLKTLTWISQEKELSYREKKMLTRARYLIANEFAHVLDQTEEDVDRMITAALESFLKKAKKKRK